MTLHRWKEREMIDGNGEPCARRDARGLARWMLLAAACVAAVAACGCSLFDREARPQASYMLSPPEQRPVAGERAASIEVRRFGAVAPFDERPFLYRTTDGTWRADADAGFIALPSDMMMVAIARALERSGRVEVVAIEGTPLRLDFALDGVIEAFYADYSDAAAPVAVVSLRGYLVDRRASGGSLVAQMTGNGRAPIRGASASDVADAFSAASGAAIAELIEALPKGRADGATDAATRGAGAR
jgi:ABC-type uncharacterized transport system auxiliary subunit